MTLARRRYRHAVQLEITDNGPGIPEELQERVFHPLVSGRDGGSGLGLTLAQTFVNQHHGIITSRASPATRPSRSCCLWKRREREPGKRNGK